MSPESQPRPQDPAALEGRLLEGRYRIDRKVGEGGFGVVYEGFHVALGVAVAIKVLRYPDDASSADRTTLLGQFLAEAQMLPRLRHPHIVSALDVGTLSIEDEATPRAWLVLEWCGSETLKNDLKKRRGSGGRSVDETWRLARPILDAIKHAHARGFVHRDVKPANIMLVESEQGVSPRVIDFGIAKVTTKNELAGTGGTQTHSRHRAFSLPYAAPEQIAGSRTGPWTDVHALALVVTELLIDDSPYGSGSEVALAVIDPKRPTPASFGVDVGPWEGVLLRAMALKPAERFKDAGEFLDAMEAALDEARMAWRKGATKSPPSSTRAAAPISSRLDPTRDEGPPSDTELTASTTAGGPSRPPSTTSQLGRPARTNEGPHPDTRDAERGSGRARWTISIGAALLLLAAAGGAWRKLRGGADTGDGRAAGAQGTMATPADGDTSSGRSSSLSTPPTPTVARTSSSDSAQPQPSTSSTPTVAEPARSTATARPAQRDTASAAPARGSSTPTFPSAQPSAKKETLY